MKYLKDKLFKAAAEPLASNVEYLNYTEQPRDVKIAFPNITKILALRSAGVISQVDGLQATVSGYGCNLESLGNAVQSRNTGTGTLAIADAATGIYLIGDYSNHGNDSRPPSLTAEKLDPSNEVYQKLKKASGVSSDEDIVVFGDGMNDICMFGQGWLSIAMGNARAALKEKADYITTDVDKDGLWNACRHFGWI